MLDREGIARLDEDATFTAGRDRGSIRALRACARIARELLVELTRVLRGDHGASSATSRTAGTAAPTGASAARRHTAAARRTTTSARRTTISARRTTTGDDATYTAPIVEAATA
jgi:hypothetical protein